MADTIAGTIAHDADSRDHFEVLGLPRRLVIDERKLADHYYRLSRLYHPDFHQSGTPAERLASLRRTAAVNDAYKTLRDPVARGRWWLERHGRKLGSSPEVPPDLAALVFDVQEMLEGLREDPDEKARQTADKRRAEVEAERYKRLAALSRIFKDWDARGDGAPVAELLEELQHTLAEISYLTTLLRDIDRALEETGVGAR
jgi:molecular chaperone HscB